MNDLEKVFVSELKDLYDCEQRILKALPEMEKQADSDELKSAFHEHLQQTKQHVDRLERVFKDIGEEPKRKTCKGIEGIIDEGQLIAKEFKGNSALDAALIGASQKVEHYEITSYGTLCSWAKELGHNQAVHLLNETLREEKQTDEALTRIAQSARNVEATRHDQKKKSETTAKLSKMMSSGS
jgi:ferritin-like metal-binding protein YciE